MPNHTNPVQVLDEPCGFPDSVKKFHHSLTELDFTEFPERCVLATERQALSPPVAFIRHFVKVIENGFSHAANLTKVNQKTKLKLKNRVNVRVNVFYCVIA